MALDDGTEGWEYPRRSFCRMTSHSASLRRAAPLATTLAFSSLMVASSAFAQDAAMVTARRDLLDQIQQIFTGAVVGDGFGSSLASSH
ncbi:MAG: hypothetical protein WCJ30_00490 [Deltaproteobacteria bacterium]